MNRRFVDVEYIDRAGLLNRRIVAMSNIYRLGGTDEPSGLRIVI